ncbi:DNA primase [Agathobacter ruminis]|uniref:DNA primase n=1 Tax=Agathobacter ruminis TaxID=1712665 RepID=A0A2G3E3H1_9FIRM|nr:DNA primase [Agathobacter ruminis]MDC7300206.1 DNA primase [Agathobacter ruminis]PHU37827.1 DNA primase [Agathobacter ruminis]
MPYYSDDIIEEVRSKNDIVDVIGSYVKLEKKGSNYFGCCPFHAEKTPSFSVTPSKQMFYCFGCHKGGNVFTFLQEYENYSFGEALEALADRAGVNLPKQELTPEKKREADKRELLLAINKEAAKYFYTLLRSERGKRAYDYFKGRELSDETMQRFGLGYSDQYSDDLYKYLRKRGYDDMLLKESGLVVIDEVRGGHDKFWNRAMFPIMDVRGRVIAFGGRVMGDGNPKYLNSPETKIFNKRRNLFALYFAKNTKKNYMLLCEGYMDVISLHQAGFDNAVASLGTALTEEQVQLLSRYTKEVCLTYDSDGAGVDAAIRAIPMLNKVGIKTKIVNMQPMKDPDEFIKAYGAEEYEKRIRDAENSFLFLIRILSRQYDMSDPTDKSSFFHETAKRLAVSFEDTLERRIYARELAKNYDVSEDELMQMVNRLGESAGLMRENDRAKDGRSRPKKEDGMKKSQMLLLSWLAERHELYLSIKGKIGADDFTDPMCHRAAQMLFEQFESGNDIVPARIIDAFTDTEEQSQIAGIFNAAIHKVESKEDMEKAIKETIIRIKQNSIEQTSKNLSPSDIEGLMKMIEDKKALEHLEKMKIEI